MQLIDGTITVINQPESLKPSSPKSSSVDTVGTLMMPTQDIQTYIADLQKRGFAIDTSKILERSKWNRG